MGEGSGEITIKNEDIFKGFAFSLKSIPVPVGNFCVSGGRGNQIWSLPWQMGAGTTERGIRLGGECNLSTERVAILGEFLH